MQKSYILKFDKIQGDYVIVEKEGVSQPMQRDKRESRGLFFNFNLFKNNKKELKNNENNVSNHEKSEGEGFLSSLDNEVKKEKEDKKELKEKLEEYQEKVETQVDQGETSNDNNLQPFQQQPGEPNINPPRVPAEPSNPQTPNRPNNGVSVGEGVQLLAELYNNFRVLNMMYQTLRDVNQNYARNFSDFITENTSLMGGLLNIYNSVSGQNNPPETGEGVPELSSRFQDIVDIVASFVQGMREIVLRLLKIFSVENFNRQFNLIEKSLSIQNDFLINLRIQNLSLKNN